MKILALLLLAVLFAIEVKADHVVIADGQAVRGNFVQERHLTGFANPLRSSGHFLLAPGKGLIWVGEQPFPMTTVITADGMMQSVGGAETFKVGAAKLPFLTKLYAMMSGALAGDWRALQSDFSILQSSDTNAGGKRQRYVMTPLHSTTSDNVFLKKMTMSVSRFVDEVVIEKPDGDRDILRFSDQSSGAANLQQNELDAFNATRP